MPFYCTFGHGHGRRCPNFSQGRGVRGYSFVHGNVAGTGFSFNGGSGSVAVNLNDWFGIASDVGFYHHGAGGGGCGECSVGSNVVSYLFGPKVAYRKSATFTPYVHGLLGGAHETLHIGGNSNSSSAFAMAFGGGVDAKASEHLAIRVGQVDYLLTRFNDGQNNRQNNVRLSVGIVFRWN